MKVTILTDSEIRNCVSMDKETIAAVAGGFSRMATGEATIPPILRMMFLITTAKWLRIGIDNIIVKAIIGT